ncbi:MAG: trans-aconitate 2-methyltransferase [Acidimicrobiia bacterium]
MKEPYYRMDLARIHHEAFSDYADSVASGVVSLLGAPCNVVELGCGGGALTRHLVAAGHRVIATDASPAMLDITRQTVPEAEIRALELPNDPIPNADAVVAVGTVFNYLASRTEVEHGLVAAARAGDLLITDILDLSYGDTRPEPVDYFHEGHGWKLWTLNTLEAPDRVVREMTIETRAGVTHERHVNLLVDVEEIASRVGAKVRGSFGDEVLPSGFRVLLASH